jgi:hypothetical protein
VLDAGGRTTHRAAAAIDSRVGDEVSLSVEIRESAATMRTLTPTLSPAGEGGAKRG